MRENFHKIFSIAMALLLLLSTTSWKVEKHYCMGRLIDVALFSDVETCGMDMFVSSESEDYKKSENSCCDNEVVFVDGQDNLKISLNDLDIDKQNFLVAYAYSYITLLQVLEEQVVPHEQYPPPILIKDIQLLDEVFLI